MNADGEGPAPAVAGTHPWQPCRPGGESGRRHSVEQARAAASHDERGRRSSLPRYTVTTTRSRRSVTVEATAPPARPCLPHHPRPGPRHRRHPGSLHPRLARDPATPGRRPLRRLVAAPRRRRELGRGPSWPPSKRGVAPLPQRQRVGGLLGRHGRGGPIERAFRQLPLDRRRRQGAGAPALPEPEPHRRSQRRSARARPSAPSRRAFGTGWPPCALRFDADDRSTAGASGERSA